MWVMTWQLFSLRSSFYALFARPEVPILRVLGWSERRDLNSGPPVPQTGALTGLRYAPPTRSSTPRGSQAQDRRRPDR